MGLDSRYIIASDLQTYIVDKDTGTPLSNGKITFYKDQARNEFKDVYILSGVAPNYSYTNIGHEVTLSAVGTVQYDNNDVILYYFPYDESGNIELYFVDCKSEDEEPQFTREAWPNFIVGGSSEDQNIKNYIPNGQFAQHNNLPETDTLVSGQIRDAETAIAPGGWYFVRPPGSTAKDIVIFNRISSDISNPTASPRYKLTVKNEEIGTGNTFKDVRIRFDNVNKFSSSTQQYTFAIAAQNDGEGIDNVSLVLIKHFGTGGSPSSDEETVLTTFNVDTTFSIKRFSFLFGVNTGKTLGTNDDDYVELALRLPLASTFSLSFDNAILAPGEVVITNFPVTTDADFRTRGIAGWMPTPDYDGMDLYLPLRLTPSGLTFDDSEVGSVEQESQLSEYTSSVHTTSNKLLADGAQYKVSDYSPLRIPYRRLFQKYYDDTLQLPIYGTGADFMTAYLSDLDPATQLRIPTNKTGAQTDASDGVTPTGFTIATIHEGSDYQKKAFIAGPDGDLVYVLGTEVASVTAPAAATSGFTIVSLRNSATEYELFSIQTIAATTLAGNHFNFSSDTDDYYMWFKVDGAGSDPAVGGRTGIEVDLLSTYTAKEVAACVREAMCGFQITTVVCEAASTLSGGEFFNIYANGVHYYVWDTVDGAGTKPIVANATEIKVELLSTDTAAQVASKYQSAINQIYFAVPDLRGYFLRGLDEDGIIDLDAARRFSNVTSYYGGKLGTQEWDANLLHSHTGETNSGQVLINVKNFNLGSGTDLGYFFNEDAGGGSPHQIALTTAATGGIQTQGATNAYESRGINKAVRIAIRY